MSKARLPETRWLFTTCSLLLLALTPSAFGQKYYTYIGDVRPTEVLIAWGTTDGSNTVGRSSPSHGTALIRIDGREIKVADKNWTVITGLKPDTAYPYEISVGNQSIAKAQVRTWPEKSEKLRFFVIGDWGSGDSAQRSVAAEMLKEFQRKNDENPVRFVITVGDNLYGQFGFTFRFNNSGDKDNHWESRFFRPYEQLIQRIPFYPSLGNHDGNETENRGDLTAYLDNFFFPSHTPSRYYRFSYGGLADFFALDSTSSSEQGPPRPSYGQGSEQHTWLQTNLAESKTPWKIPYFHHPVFNAGPRHPAVLNELSHFVDLFKKQEVKVVFTGHEHNFQISEKTGVTGNIRYLVSGAGGELRTGSVQGSMAQSHIEGWAAVLHFLSVEIDGKQMRITPISPTPFEVITKDGKKMPMPLEVSLD